MILIEDNYEKPDFSNVHLNQKKKKNKANSFNEFKSITELIKIYKETNSNEDLLVILENLSGIVNTFCLVIAPGNTNQQIYITPYMKKLLGMFLSKEEQANSTDATFNQALARVRWIMREYTYSDVYSHILLLLINVVKNIKIIGDCDCFYYIQWIMKFKVHKYIKDQIKDAMVGVQDVYINPNDLDEESNFDDIIGRISNSQNAFDQENELIDNYCRIDGINMLLRNDDIFKCLGHWEKYILYLSNFIELDNKSIINLLKNITEEELQEVLSDIKLKYELGEQIGRENY